MAANTSASLQDENTGATLWADSVGDSSLEESYTRSLSIAHRRRDSRYSSYSGIAPERRRRRLGSRGERGAKCPVPTFVVAFLTAAATLAAVEHVNEVDLNHDLRMLRGSFLAILLGFLFLVNVRAWQMFDIDYVKIFDLDEDQDDYQTPRTVGIVCSCLGMLWAAFALVVNYSLELEMDSFRHTLPLVLWLVIVIFMVNPFHCFFYRSRHWFLCCMGRVVSAPFHRVSFVDSWLADQLTSLTVTLLDLEYTLCFLIKQQWMGDSLSHTDICMSPTIGIRQILGALPSWFRMAQCIRCYIDTRQPHHLVNAGKYLSTFPVIVAASYVAATAETNDHWHSHPRFFIWLALALIHAVYVYVWDVVMDWGLLRQQPFNPFLRAHLLYQNRGLYYAAMLVDLVFRFIWTLKMSVSISTWFGSDELLLLLAIAEVLRRFMWNFFRLEFQQTKGMEELLPIHYTANGEYDAMELSERTSPCGE